MSTLRKYLISHGEWDEQLGEKVTLEVADQVEAAITEIEAQPLPTHDDVAPAMPSPEFPRS